MDMQHNQKGFDTTKENLVDISQVVVDPTLPLSQRIVAFTRQINNPYRFQSGKFVVDVTFSNDGPSFEECLRSILG